MSTNRQERVRRPLESGGRARRRRRGDGDPLGSKGEPLAAAPRVGRNEPCPCGSGKKSKRCCP